MNSKFEEYGYDSAPVGRSTDRPVNYDNEDVFGHEEGHDVNQPTLESLPNLNHLLLTASVRSNTRRYHGNSSPC